VLTINGLIGFVREKMSHFYHIAVVVRFNPLLEK